MEHSVYLEAVFISAPTSSPRSTTVKADRQSFNLTVGFHSYFAASITLCALGD